MSRAKKNVEIENIQNQVCIYLFDCLYLDGVSLLEETLTKRRAAMRTAFNEIPKKVSHVVSKEADDFDAIQEFLNQSVKGNLSS